MSAVARGSSGAVRLSPGPRLRPVAWLTRHLQTLCYSLGHLARTPGGTLMTAAVIGIALALPGGLYLLLDNVKQVSREWDGGAQVSLFLRGDVSGARAAALAQELRERPAVREVRLITPAQALEEYRRLSGFGAVLDAFGGENPLPAVLVVRPDANHARPGAVRELVEELGRRPEVDLAQFDLEWLERLSALLELGRRGVLVLGVLLGLGVALVVGNTIRLSILNRRAEIEVARLFGATDAFIRRPFLYTGFWYGLLGGLIAWVLLGASIWLLRGPVGELAGLYHSHFRLSGPGGGGGLALGAAGALLGLAGSWLAVARHLDAIEPS